LSQELQDALRDLGPATDKAGALGVIRVLMSYPAKPHLDTLTKVTNVDVSNHPAATVDVESLAKHPSDQELLESLKLRVSAAAQRKRKASCDRADAAKRRKGDKSDR
jgi:hypothetical protein